MQPTRTGPAGPARQRPPCRLPPRDSRTEARGRSVRARARATSCLPPRPGSAKDATHPLRPLSTPSRAHPLLLLSLSLRTSDPSGAAATDADCHSHRAPHASPTPQGAPPRPPPSSPPTHGPPEALQRRHHRRSVAGHRSSPPSIRRTPCLPCLASSTRRTAVSRCIVSPMSRCLIRPLAAPSTGAETLRRTGSSPVKLR